MRTIENENDKVVCFDYIAWLQERNLMYFTHTDGTIEDNVVRLAIDSPESVIARYTLNGTNEVVIDVTDLIRSLETPHTLFLRCGSDTATPLEIPYLIGGLINPNSVILPNSIPSWKTDELKWNALGMDIPTIVPPSMMIQAGFLTMYELTGVHGGEGYSFDNSIAVGNYQPFPTDVDTIKIFPNSTEYGVAETYRGTPVLQGKMAEFICGKKYALVSWVSFTGQTRMHTFEVRESKISVGDSISLMPIGSDYNTIKGREDSFSLFLDNLSAYDYWYYADIITSSKVAVSFDGITFRQVDVTTKSVTIPDGDAGKMNELNVSVKYRKYDAVAM